MIDVSSQPAVNSLLERLPRTMDGLPVLNGIVISDVLGQGGTEIVRKNKLSKETQRLRESLPATKMAKAFMDEKPLV